MSTLTRAQTAEWLLSRDGFLILTHLRPDGDTVGCAAALCRALREQGKRAFILNDPGTSAIYTPYLEGLLAPADFVPDTVAAVDVAAANLLTDEARPYLDRIDLVIDHHPSQTFYGANTCVDAGCAACGELVYDVVRLWGEVSASVALPLYVAVSTDTGCFVYGNTTPNTHRVAAALMDTGIDVTPVNHRHFRTKSAKRLKIEGMLVAGMQVYDGGTLAVVTLTLAMMDAVGAGEEDVDNISALVGEIEGVHTGVTVRQLTPTQCKVSLRTRPEELNASDVCALLGGGGHAAAAGLTMDASPEETARAVLDAIRTIQNRK